MSNTEPTHVPDRWSVELDAFQQDGSEEARALACWLFLHDPIIRTDVEVTE